jgi:hypothetical protein
MEAGIAFFQRWDLSSIRKEDVEESIIVVVENCDTASHRLNGVALWTNTILQNEIYFGRFDRILEDNCRIGRLTSGGGSGQYRRCSGMHRSAA